MTLLSRTADNLYWFGRYLERAENTARLIDVAYRMSRLPESDLALNAEWVGALLIVGQKEEFDERFKKPTQRKVIDFLAFDDKNPSSIKNCIRFARENGRAERNSIPTEVFESLNATWLVLKTLDSKTVARDGYREFFEWVKDRVHALRGLTAGVMLQTEGYKFHRIGTFIERGDNTARLLDVKYHVLATEGEDTVGDYYRWGALLRSLSAFKSYRTVYKNAVQPRNVAELLLINPAFPRSINHCTGVVAGLLMELAPQARSAAMARRLHKRYSKDTIEALVRSRDLHDMLEDFTDDNAALSDQIAKDFLLVS